MLVAALRLPLVSDVGWAAGGRVRAFVVRLPSGVRYWTVLESDLRRHRAADDFLRHLRFGRGCAESTTRAYATSVSLYLLWCGPGETFRVRGPRCAFADTTCGGAQRATGIPEIAAPAPAWRRCRRAARFRAIWRRARAPTERCHCYGSRRNHHSPLAPPNSVDRPAQRATGAGLTGRLVGRSGGAGCRQEMCNQSSSPWS